jgi:hypothetical protein
VHEAVNGGHHVRIEEIAAPPQGRRKAAEKQARLLATDACQARQDGRMKQQSGIDRLIGLVLVFLMEVRCQVAKKPLVRFIG